METAARSLDFDGDKRGARLISQKAQCVKRIIEDYSSHQENINKRNFKSLDFTNPSNEMIEKFNGMKYVMTKPILTLIHFKVLSI